jgi:hypothetical protein
MAETTEIIALCFTNLTGWSLYKTNKKGRSLYRAGERRVFDEKLKLLLYYSRRVTWLFYKRDISIQDPRFRGALFQYSFPFSTPRHSFISINFSMRFSLSVLLFAGATVASALSRRQNNGAKKERQLEQGPCKRITFIFGRGSTETGNMVCH